MYIFKVYTCYTKYIVNFVQNKNHTFCWNMWTQSLQPFLLKVQLFDEVFIQKFKGKKITEE